MTLSQIHDKTIDLLKSNPETVLKRRYQIALVAQGLRDLKKLGKLPTLRPRLAWFSTTQTQTQKGKADVNLQVLGKAVGELSLDSQRKWIFRPKSKDVPESWQWSENDEDAEKINEFLLQAKSKRKHKLADEREMQWQFANALRSHKHVEACRRLQPVTWNRCFTEVGVLVNKDGRIGAQPGNIDLIVRRDRGFLVFEIKAPGDNKVKDALIQTLRYATALEFESNEGNIEDLKNYNFVLGSKAKRKLKIGAVIVMENSVDVKNRAPAILEAAWKDRGESKLDRIGMLLYKFDKATGKADSWEWLKGWDVRTDF